jgi:hypothetical protein
MILPSALFGSQTQELHLQWMRLPPRATRSCRLDYRRDLSKAPPRGLQGERESNFTPGDSELQMLDH